MALFSHEMSEQHDLTYYAKTVGINGVEVSVSRGDATVTATGLSEEEAALKAVALLDGEPVADESVEGVEVVDPDSTDDLDEGGSTPGWS